MNTNPSSRDHLDELLNRRLELEALAVASPPFKRSIAPFEIHGLGLPEDIAAKILHQNAVRLLGL